MKKLVLITSILFMMISCKEKNGIENNAIDRNNMDFTEDPARDFYTYANGNWLKNNPIPKEKSRFGAFDLLNDLADEQVKTIIEEAATKTQQPGTIAEKINFFYNSGMNMEERNATGLSPLKPELEIIQNIKTQTDLIKALATFQRMGIRTVFSVYVGSDPKNSNMNVIRLFQGGLGLPNKEYYLEDSEEMGTIRKSYMEYITEVFMQMDYDKSKAKKTAEAVMSFETALAKASMDKLELRDPYKCYNKMNLSELNKNSKNIEWKLYFDILGVGDPKDVIVGQPDFFSAMSKMITQTPISTWKEYLKWTLINSHATYLSENFIDLHFGFYNKTLSGKEENLPLWKRVQGALDNAMGEAIGELYVEKYFPAEAKTRMVNLVNNLRIALEERINNLDWMSKETKIKGIEKLNAINVKIGYPDEWRDFSDLTISKQPFVKNILAAKAFNTAYSLEKVNKPVDPKRWMMPPQMVNAYYSPTMNDIVFPAAILQPPFFFMDADDAVNYGAIGVVIGHEMTHGFDDKGRFYDKDGNLNTWWTDEDGEKFKERAEILTNQFNQFIVIDTMHANGKLCLGENIADLGGLNISYTAFLKTEQAKSKKEIAGFTPAQRFFLAYARIWGQNIRDQEIINRTRNDVHSLGKFRVLGPLKNMPEFHEAFGVKEGDQMYLPKEERASIW